VTVINGTMAEKLWPGEDPIGKSFLSAEPAIKVTVIGVTPDGKYGSAYESPRPLMYLPFCQHYQNTINVVARTEGDPRLWIEPMRQTVRAAGVDHVFEPMTLREWMNFGLFTERATAVCVTVLAALDLLLAMSGLLGAISYSVNERNKELGIRVALGARHGQLIRMVLRETVRVTAIGIFIGTLPGIAATNLLRSQLYGISPVEWSVLIPVGASMMIVSVIVAYVSARPWIAVDPMEAVRHA
jgi:putative ABC transport system permease protein